MAIRNFLRVSCIGLTVFAIAACGKKAPAPAEPKATEAPAPAASPSEPTAAEKPASENPYDGEWQGAAEPDRPLNFTVEGGKVTFFFANYGGTNGTCSYSGAFSLDGTFPVNGNAFTATGKTPSGDVESTATGTFAANNEVAGTIAWKGKSEMCGAFDIKANWKAKKSAE